MKENKKERGGVYNKQKGEFVETNPNGANQYHLDPRQKACWDYYIDPKSETFGNAKQSALRAGYAETHADQITTQEWFMEKTRRMNMLRKAERNLDEFMDIPMVNVKITEGGEVTSYDAQLARVRLDATKFVAERLGKDEGWANREERTGANGKDLIPISPDKAAAIQKALADML